MQPWRISAGLTAAIAGAAVLIGAERLDYLAPYRRVLLAEHGAVVGMHGGLIVVAVAAAIYGAARACGLADMGRRVDLAERSMRRGEGDAAFSRDAEGKWE